MSQPNRHRVLTESVCRGCAGMGLGHHLTARELQFANRGVEMTQTTPSETSVSGETVRSNRVARRVLMVCPFGQWNNGRRAGTFRGPLANVLLEIERLKEQGFEFDWNTVEPTKAWACDWCHGTGTPQQLSAHNLERAMQQGNGE